MQYPKKSYEYERPYLQLPLPVPYLEMPQIEEPKEDLPRRVFDIAEDSNNSRVIILEM